MKWVSGSMPLGVMSCQDPVDFWFLATKRQRHSSKCSYRCLILGQSDETRATIT